MILHVDMDAFFASIEQRDTPEYRGRPLVVGGRSDRSVVAAASYEARTFGIRSAMPMYQAIQRCPSLIVVPVNKPRYAEVSRQILEVFHSVSPVVEAVSIDEAFLDISGCQRLLGSPQAIAMIIKTRIRAATHLTCSIGAAPLKFLAKIASDMNKPDGILVIEDQEALDFARAVAIRKIPGVGAGAMKQMNLLGIRTLGDITRLSRDLVCSKFGKFGETLWEYAHGRDSSVVESREARKSVSSEETLERDTSDRLILKQCLLAHAQRVSRDLRRYGLKASTLFIKLKFSDFTQITRQNRFNPGDCSSSALYRSAVNLFDQTVLQKKVRLIGLGVSSVHGEGEPFQMDIFDPPGPSKWERVDQALDSISEKFGGTMIKKASLV
ncbi:MAG: DNA polymerase IV [Pseudomonadota bacterium]